MRADLTSSTNFDFDKRDPFAQRKSVLGLVPLLTKYDSKAETGQMSSPVLPITTVTPILPWSVFECLIFKDMTDGLCALSVARSLMDKWVLGS